jgi:hypothetical protein
MLFGVLVTLIPDTSFKSPYNENSALAKAPVYGETKVRLLINPPVEIVVPLDPPEFISKLMLFVSDTAPAVITLAPVPVIIINGVPVTVHVVEPVNCIETPLIVIVFVPNARVPLNPVIVSLLIVRLISKVDTPVPEEALNITGSPVSGTLAPGEPPEDALQLFVLDQLPVPPVLPVTQYLVGIIHLPHQA